MKRYSIEMTSLEWALIAVDLGSTMKVSSSGDKLANLIRLILEHRENSEMGLPYNVKEADRVAVD